MAGYIGSKTSVVSSGVERKKTYSITGSTTSLTGLNYTVGKVHVYQNGVRLLDGTDYTATNGTSITLTVAAQSGDNVVVVSQASFQLSESYTSTESDARYVQPTHTGNVNITGTVTSDGLTTDSITNSSGNLNVNTTQSFALTFDSNNDQTNREFNLMHDNGVRIITADENGDIRFYEDTGTTAKFFWDASAESLGIGTSSPSAPIDVVTNSNVYAAEFTQSNTSNGDGVSIVVGSTASSDYALTVRSDGGNTSGLAVKADGKVGIGTFLPSTYDSRSNNLVVGDSGDSGITIFSGATSNARLQFAPSGSTGLDNGLIDYDNNNDSMSFATGGSERMRLDSSGRLLLGTSTSFADGNSENLQIAGSANTGMIIKSGSAAYGSIYFGDATSGGARNAGIVRYFHNDNSMQFWTNETERMRIDSSGNVLVGTTTTEPPTNNDASGIALQANGKVAASRSNGISGDFNTGVNGDIVWFRKSGTVIGSIGVSSSAYLTIGTGDTGILFDPPGNRFYPCNASTQANRDNAIDVGASNVRFDDIYATNGTIQTSDFNEKQDIASLTATEMLVGKRISALFKTFRWKDSVAENGDNARTHTGVIAQDVQAAFTAEGLDAGDYALFISSTWWEHDVDVPAVEAVDEVTDEDGNVTTEAVEAVDAYTRTDNYDTEDEAPEGATERTRMGIRYPELLSFVAAYNEQRFASIEARLTALEA